MTWQEKLQMMSERLREPEMLDSANVTGYGDIPYFTKDIAEQSLVYAGAQILLDASDEELQAIEANPAITVLTGPVTTTSGITSAPLGANTLRVLSASIDGAPAAYASPANFIQRLPGGARTSNCYTYLTGKLAFKGTTLSATLLVEPTLAQWRDPNQPIIPPGRDLEHVDKAIERMTIADFQTTQ